MKGQYWRVSSLYGQQREGHLSSFRGSSGRKRWYKWCLASSKSYGVKSLSRWYICQVHELGIEPWPWANARCVTKGVKAFANERNQLHHGAADSNLLWLDFGRGPEVLQHICAVNPMAADVAVSQEPGPCDAWRNQWETNCCAAGTAIWNERCYHCFEPRTTKFLLQQPQSTWKGASGLHLGLGKHRVLPAQTAAPGKNQKLSRLWLACLATACTAF